MASPNMLSDGTLIWSNSVDYDLVNGRLLATNPDSSYRWAYNDFFVARFAPAVSATDTIYATIADCEHWQREARCAQTFRLHAINPDGSTQWYTDQLGNARSPSVADDGRIYTPSLGGLYCHNSDGTQAWHLAMGISYGHAVAIGADGCVYSGLHTDYDNELCYLYAINLDGTVRWTYEIPYGTGISYSAPAIDGAGTIYMGHADGLHAINPDGSLKWVFERGYHEYGAPYSPAIGEDGTVYIGFGGTLYAIGPGAS